MAQDFTKNNLKQMAWNIFKLVKITQFVVKGPFASAF